MSDSKGKSLTIIEQRDVAFYDDQLIAIRAQDGQVYVAIGQMCDALGLDRSSQTRRIRNDEVLVDGYQGSVNLTYPDGGVQRSGVLRVDLVPLWLTGVRLKAVKDEIRPKLKRFQKEAARVLWEAFQEGRLTGDPVFEELLQTDSDTVQAYKMIQGMLKLARNQIILESRLSIHQEQIAEHDQRLEAIETQLGDETRTVSQDQAVQISQAVKAIGMVWSKKSKHNQYGAVYGRFYQQFNVTSYKLLPEYRFRAAMNWLTQWYQELTGEEDVPF